MSGLVLLLIVFVVLLLINAPIAFVIGGAGIAWFMVSSGIPTSIIVQRVVAQTQSISFLAVPFFILAGNIMNQGGIAKRLVDFVMAILGKMPGALLVTNIGTNALFGAISGSASAAAAAVGSMIRDGAE